MDVKAAGANCLNLSDKLIHNMIDEEKAKILTNKQYVKEQLYKLQIEETIDRLEHLNKQTC